MNSIHTNIPVHNPAPPPRSLRVVSSRTVEKHQLTETSRVYYVNYIRHSRAIAFLWALFSVCVAIMAIVVLLQVNTVLPKSDFIF